MKRYLILCACLLWLGLATLPIGYFTFLRIAITVGAVLAIFSDLEKGFGFWSIVFIVIGILFNPVLPVYLGSKSAWAPVDIVAGLLFIIRAFVAEPQTKHS